MRGDGEWEVWNEGTGSGRCGMRRDGEWEVWRTCDDDKRIVSSHGAGAHLSRLMYQWVS